MSEEKTSNINDSAEEVKEETSSSQTETASEEADAHWYVVGTQSGYEKSVKNSIMNTVKNNKRLENKIFDVFIPTIEQQVQKDGVYKTVIKKKAPGYVYVNMVYDQYVWYIVRNTPGVKGFISMDPKKPIPLTDEEVIREGMNVKNYDMGVEEGDLIKIIGGPWSDDEVRKVESVNAENKTVKVKIDIFGRATDVEVEVFNIKKM